MCRTIKYKGGMAMKAHSSVIRQVVIWASAAVVVTGAAGYFVGREKRVEAEVAAAEKEFYAAYAYVHGDDFVEPVLTKGDYYIDGNVKNDRFYVHIDDETYNVCGDVEGYLDTFITFFDEDDKADTIKLYSKPIRYDIKTFHDNGDRTVIRLEQDTAEGLQFSSGPLFLSETSFKEGDNVFKLVENVDSL